VNEDDGNSPPARNSFADEYQRGYAERTRQHAEWIHQQELAATGKERQEQERKQGRVMFFVGVAVLLLLLALTVLMGGSCGDYQ
jgi:cytochrome c-type biogenesis protein CcmH/NrfG